MILQCSHKEVRDCRQRPCDEQQRGRICSALQSPRVSLDEEAAGFCHRSEKRLHPRSESDEGKWKSRKGLYREKYLEAVRLCARFAKLRFRWVPREENEEADLLSREAYRPSSLV